jgi:MoxR-like ATPase
MQYTRKTDDIPRNPVQLSQLGRDHPADYRPDRGLVDAVNVALLLNRPLLLTGDPGTGKTQLAYSVAWQLAGRHQLNVASPCVERFEAKSTSAAKDLFYSFDALGRYQAAQVAGRLSVDPQAGRGAGQENLDYITYNALGRALLRAFPRSQVESYLTRGFEHGGPARSVVLIDEIDKAPRDFPNDLLTELDEMYFRIPELGNAIIGGPEMLPPDLAPLVFVTSNSEKNLPDPFLRRCIYYNIPFPDTDELREILLVRLRGLLPGDGALLKDALDFFMALRSHGVPGRQISPPELIQWITVMLQRGADPAKPLKAAAVHAFEGLGALSKNKDDQVRVCTQLEIHLGVSRQVARD